MGLRGILTAPTPAGKNAAKEGAVKEGLSSECDPKDEKKANGVVGVGAVGCRRVPWRER